MVKDKTEKPVDINGLPSKSRNKVRRIRYRINRGGHNVIGEEVDRKILEGLLYDIKKK